MFYSFDDTVNGVIFLILLQIVHYTYITIQFLYWVHILQLCWIHPLLWIVFSGFLRMSMYRIMSSVLLPFQSFQCLLFLFPIKLLWLEPPVQCQAEVAREDTLVHSWSWGKTSSISLFWCSCGFFTDALCQLGKLSFYFYWLTVFFLSWKGVGFCQVLSLCLEIIMFLLFILLICCIS